jgi:hypothetical protein
MMGSARVEPVFSTHDTWGRMQHPPVFSLAVRTLADILGCRLTAYVAGVRDARVVDLWIAGIPDPGVEVRLRSAHSIASMLSATERPAAVRAWFLEPQPRLGNRSPALVIREGGDPHDVVAAAALSLHQGSID